ncbi:MAG: DNA polymerase III subunit chi [Alteromonadaceae bacterium]|nr:DNA polymerase III subunit chi [Alteromonadaceae bacterium]
MQQTQVMFYILQNDKTQESIATADNDKNKLFHQACLQAAHFYRQNQRVFIYTQDQASAHNIDEMLWAFDANSFVPHNLTGEGTNYGAAVEISWQTPTNRRAVLINLTSTVPNFANRFSRIIDFVPTDETMKQQARVRFSTCRKLGFSVDTQPAFVPQEHVESHS